MVVVVGEGEGLEGGFRNLIIYDSKIKCQLKAIIIIFSFFLSKGIIFSMILIHTVR